MVSIASTEPVQYTLGALPITMHNITAGVVSLPAIVSGVAHAEASPSRLHAASDQEAVPWLKHMQGTGEVGERHCTHEHRELFTLTEANPV